FCKVAVAAHPLPMLFPVTVAEIESKIKNPGSAFTTNVAFAFGSLVLSFAQVCLNISVCPEGHALFSTFNSARTGRKPETECRVVPLFSMKGICIENESHCEAVFIWTSQTVPSLYFVVGCRHLLLSITCLAGIRTAC